jgi:hypothetical protein
MHSARDGKNITVPSLEAALHTALHMSPLAAKSLTSALKPLLREDGTFDLVDTRKHNVSGDGVCDENGDCMRAKGEASGSCTIPRSILHELSLFHERKDESSYRYSYKRGKP